MRYDEAIALSPTDVELLENRAQIARLEEDYGRAAELLERVIALAPKDTNVLRTAAETYELAGREEAATRLMRSYVAAEPGDSSGSVYLAELLASQERYADALAVLEVVVESETIAEGERALAGFAKAEILLTAAEEQQHGLQALTEAVALGFDDRAAAEALLEREDLIARDEVRVVLQMAGVVGEDSEAAEQEPAEGSENGAGIEASTPPE